MKPTPTLFRHLNLVAAVLILSWCHSNVAHADSLTERTNRGVVELLTSGDPASIEMAQDLASVIDDGATRRLVPVVGHGAVDGLIDLKVLHGIDLTITQTDVLNYAKQRQTPPAIETVTYIARLYNEELHVLARRDITRIQDLNNKKVDFAGGARITGPAVLSLLNVNVNPVFDNHAEALRKLISGDAAALVYVAAKPTPLFAGVTSGEGFHFLTVPITPALAKTYIPAQLTQADYPNLVPADEPVDTVAVGTALIVANLQPGTIRYNNVSNFVDAFFTLFSRLQEAPHHPKWKTVNLTAQLSGWTRFGPAATWLQRNVVAKAAPVSNTDLRQIFNEFLDQRSKVNGGQPLTQQEKDQLFDQFVRWQQGAQAR